MWLNEREIWQKVRNGGKQNHKRALQVIVKMCALFLVTLKIIGGFARRVNSSFKYWWPCAEWTGLAKYECRQAKKEVIARGA